MTFLNSNYFAPLTPLFGGLPLINITTPNYTTITTTTSGTGIGNGGFLLGGMVSSLGQAGLQQTYQYQNQIQQTLPFLPGKVLEKSLVAGPILAQRSWLVIRTEVGFRLGPLVCSPSVWAGVVPGEPKKAYCTLYGVQHDAPVAGCTCGIYAMKSEHVQVLQGNPPGFQETYIARGRVALWGRVIEHEFGYRAEFAYPYELFRETHATSCKKMPGFPAIAAQPTTIDELARVYGVPVVSDCV